MGPARAPPSISSRERCARIPERSSWRGETSPDKRRLRWRGSASRDRFRSRTCFLVWSAVENVRLACQTLERRHRYLARLDRLSRPQARARAILEEFGLQERTNELVGNLSHGDQRRVEIAVCMALGPRLLMLDEPTQGMSPSETAEFDALIKSLAGRVTIPLIEHDIDLVMSLSDHVIVMHQGEKLFEGTPDRVRASPLVREAYLGVDHAAA